MAHGGKKKLEAAQEGAPLWCIVYADMVTQLMAFFIMLFAISEVRSDKAMMITKSIHHALGRKMQPGGAAGTRAATSLAQFQAALETSLHGSDVQVLTVREGKMVAIGGHVLFDRGSAQLLPVSYKVLSEAADIVKGYRNRVDIRGHASQGEVGPGSRFADDWDLSWHRARAVADFLVRTGNIPEARLRVTGCSYFDPAAASMFADEDARNRRVEIVEVADLVSN